MAKYNSNHYNVADRILFLKGSLLEPVEPSVDLLIANLPYVLSQKLSDLRPEIKYYEPKIALDGGPDGLGMISELLHKAQEKLHHNGCLILEIGENQEQQIMSAINRYLKNATFDILKDYSGLPRIAKIDLHS
mgnify:CR=1 FL=1